ncbi:DUF4476 domain-containing protein [Sphingobacteriales bacterium UPWRP_1]|nr:hypothetical protein B6N25_16185 [Sphingobacteriales bacterium TSM_CSS]PSJ71845.1 DUF4476 domain-containing protein [Sphingobacteriales bacterium UPWRP_1]
MNTPHNSNRQQTFWSFTRSFRCGVRLWLCVALLLFTLFAAAQNNTGTADLVLYSGQTNLRFLLGVNGVQYTDKPVSGIKITEIPTPLCVVQIVAIGQTATDTITRNLYLKDKGDYIYTLDTAATQQTNLFYETEDVSPKQLKGFLKKTFLPPALKHVVIDTTAMYHVRGAAVLIKGVNQLKIQWFQKGNCNNAIPASDAVFETVKSKIKEKSFESDKLKVAKQQISARCFSAKQIEQILQLFDFERIKLDVAKFAYHFITDVQNHMLLCNTFEFDATVAEWNRYVAAVQAEMQP